MGPWPICTRRGIWVYGKATTILIKDDYPRESVAATVLASTNGIVNTGATNLDNEIFLLSSHSLLKTVVRDLKLDVTYWKKNGFRKVESLSGLPYCGAVYAGGKTADARFLVIPFPERNSAWKRMKDHHGHETGVFGNQVRFDSQAFIVEKTPSLTKAGLNVPVIVGENFREECGDGAGKRLTVRKASGKNDLINISMRCNNPVKSLYVLLLNKREENPLALAATEDNARMVDGVRGGNGPLEPNVPKILMVGFLAGMAIPVFLCVVAAMLDSSVKRRKEIETLTSIPVYGELPRKPRKLKNQEIVVNLEEPSELSECFPLLAERMVALSDGNGGNPSAS